MTADATLHTYTALPGTVSLALVFVDGSSSSDETRDRVSKIFLSIVYLWTERGPEINNGSGSGPGAVPLKDSTTGLESG